ncbi:MAG: hypothetical protein Q8829_02875, partial [Candidatus Phytoplasma australasiaticum]|nr:hypothetical protein [Candidatus Phytoplasma australasiaticum]
GQSNGNKSLGQGQSNENKSLGQGQSNENKSLGQGQSNGSAEHFLSARKLGAWSCSSCLSVVV